MYRTNQYWVLIFQHHPPPPPFHSYRDSQRMSCTDASVFLVNVFWAQNLSLFHSPISKCRYHLFLVISSFLRLCTSWSVNCTSLWLITPLYLYTVSSVHITDEWYGIFPQNHPKLMLCFCIIIVIPLLWVSTEHPLVIFQHFIIGNNVFLCTFLWPSVALHLQILILQC